MFIYHNGLKSEILREVGKRMRIREIEKSDAEKYLKLLLKLDEEDNKMATQVYK